MAGLSIAPDLSSYKFSTDLSFRSHTYFIRWFLSPPSHTSTAFEKAIPSEKVKRERKNYYATTNDFMISFFGFLGGK